MPVEHDAAPAEGVGDQAVGTRLDVAALNLQHPLGVREVPDLTAIPRAEPGLLQLRAHRAVAQEHPIGKGFQ